MSEDMVVKLLVVIAIISYFMGLVFLREWRKSK